MNDPAASGRGGSRLERFVWVTVALLALVAATVSAATPALRPGDPLGIPASCTLNFGFRDAEATYIGTAAHCVGGVGSDVENQVHGHFGVVDTVLPEVDFALIRLDPDEVLDPQVIDVGGPTGIAFRRDTLTGDLLEMYGHGLAVGLTVETRERNGILAGDNATEFWWDSVTTIGDSGAPVLLQGNGLALGIVSQVGLLDHQSTDTGPTVAHILDRLAAAGRPVTLVTAAPII